MSLGLIEILLVILVFLLLGPRRIADLFRSVGRGAHDFIESLGRDKKEELPDEERDAEQDPRR
jgi:Sec-independent protein translocase protein TatA